MKTRDDWAKRREELRALILHYEFGQLPPPPSNVAGVEQASKVIAAINATERHILLTIDCGNDKKIEYDLYLTVPRGQQGPLPTIVKGDLCWGRVAEPIRAEIARRGYVLAEFDRTQIAPDKAGRESGVYPYSMRLSPPESPVTESPIVMLGRQDRDRQAARIDELLGRVFRFLVGILEALRDVEPPLRDVAKLSAALQILPPSLTQDANRKRRLRAGILGGWPKIGLDAGRVI